MLPLSGDGTGSSRLMVSAIGTECTWDKAEDPLVVWQQRIVRMV